MVELVVDVIDTIADCAKFTFLGVSKRYQHRVITRIKTGKVPFPRLNFEAMNKIIINNDIEIFKLAIKSMRYKGYTGYNNLLRTSLRYEKYEATEIITLNISKDYATSLLQQVDDAKHHIKKYYDIHGLDGIIVNKWNTITATKWHIKFNAEHFLQLLPDHLLDKLQDACYNHITTHRHIIYNRKIYKSVAPERIYRIFRYPGLLLHYKLFIQMLRMGALNYVSDLINIGVTISLGGELKVYIYTFIYDPTPDYTHLELSQVRATTCAGTRYWADHDIMIMRAWDKYISAITIPDVKNNIDVLTKNPVETTVPLMLSKDRDDNTKNPVETTVPLMLSKDRDDNTKNLMHTFASIMSSLNTCDPLSVAYMYDTVEMLLLWCVAKRDGVLCSHILQNKDMMLIFNRQIVFKRDARLVSTIVQILTIFKIDIMLDEYKLVYKALPYIITYAYRNDKSDVVNSFNINTPLMAIATGEYINEIVNLIICIINDKLPHISLNMEDDHIISTLGVVYLNANVIRLVITLITSNNLAHALGANRY